jgi:hypothetical protein
MGVEAEACACLVEQGAARVLLEATVLPRPVSWYPFAEGRLPDLRGTCLGSYERSFERR